MWYRSSNGPREHGASLYAADEPRTGLRQPLLASSTGNTGSSTGSSSTSSRAPEGGAQVVQPAPVSTPRQPAIQQLKQDSRTVIIAAPSQPSAVDASSISDQLPASSRSLKPNACLAPAGPELLPVVLHQPPSQAPATAPATADTSASSAPKQHQQQQVKAQIVSTASQAPAPASRATSVSPPRACSPPVVEVELQRASSSEIDSNVSSGSNSSRPASPCSDPLLHWSDIWSGPGIPGVRRRHTNSSNRSSSSRPAAAAAVGLSAAAAATGAGSPRCSSPVAASTRPSHVWWAGIEQSQPPQSPTAAAAAAAAAGAGAGAAAASRTAAAAGAAGASALAAGAAAESAAAPNSGASKRKDTSKTRSSGNSAELRNLQMQQLPSSLREALQIQQQQQQHVQLAQPLLLYDSSSGPAATRRPRTQQQQQQGSSVKWWLVGGAALAVISSSAVVAAYVTISYMMKAAMVYSFAWKAATGVAAAEGLAIGGWGCSSVRKQKAAAAASAADLVRLQSAAAKELAALRGLLQQREAEHGQELTSLSTLNERLNHLAQGLRTENSNLQGALERAAAERKSLEAAAALQAAQAQSGALVEMAAAHSDRVVGEVAELARGQQQLVALVCELREDLLGLITDKDITVVSDMLVTATTAASGVSAELVEDLAACSSGASLEWLQHTSQPQLAAEQAVAPNGATEASLTRSCSAPAAAAAQGGPALVDDAGAAELNMFVGNSSSNSSSNGAAGKPPGLRLKSVRGSVDAALAASIADTLQL